MKYTVVKGLIKSRDKGKLTLVNSDKYLLYSLNETSSLILDKVGQGKDEDDIVAYMVKKYRIDKTQAEKDVRNCLKELLKKKIISSLKSPRAPK